MAQANFRECKENSTWQRLWECYCLDMPEVLDKSDCGGKSNIHHNIASSRGGSDDESNLSQPHVGRHTGFHSWAENKTTCQQVRQLALHALGNGDRSVTPETFYALMRATHIREWASYYNQRAIRSVADVFDLHTVVQPQKHLRRQTLEELTWTLQTIEALDQKGEYPAEKHLLLPKALEFFNTDSPREAIRALLCEKRNNEYLWTKPMQEEERKNMLRAVDAPETFISKSRVFDLRKILARHASGLDKFQESMRPLIEQYERFNATPGDIPGAA